MGYNVRRDFVSVREFADRIGFSPSARLVSQVSRRPFPPPILHVAMMHFDGRPITYYLKSYRRHAHLSQAELAYLLGASSGAMVSRYEAGDRTPSLQTGLAYEAALGEPVSKLFRGSYGEIQARVAERRRHLAIEEKRQGASLGSAAHHIS